MPLKSQMIKNIFQNALLQMQSTTTEMPNVEYKGVTLNVKDGANLRTALLENGLSPHNEAARYLNCRGLGTCGTCAVKISGKLGNVKGIEKWRLNFPPHTSDSGLRLACQVEVHADMAVEKADGFWGEKT